MDNGSSKKSSSLKNDITASYLQVDSKDQYLRNKAAALNIVDGARLSITGLALLCGITILALSGNAVSVYNSTRLQETGWLSIWPAAFDLRPTVALVVGSCIVTIANIAGLLCSKVPHVSPPRKSWHSATTNHPTLTQIRNNTPLHTPMMFVAPFVGFAAAMIAIIFFYAINSSTTVDTLLSWTCRWKAVSMASDPYFGTLCSSSWASVYLAVVLVPLEAAALCVAGWQLKTEKHVARYARARQGSQSPPA